MAKRKLVYAVGEAKKPKDIDGCKRIFLNSSDDTISRIAECMESVYKNVAPELDINDYVYEIKSLMRGEYGDWNENASLYYEKNGNAAGAIFISIYEKTPLLTYLFTRAEYLGDAVASRLIEVSSYVLKLSGQKEFAVYIDDSDSETYNLYRTMGFKPEERVIT